ncbi:MAG TPA: hypothetical protein VI504_03690 [Candidatus Eisenbacteria bacterium]|jgi:hypothetical protein
MKKLGTTLAVSTVALAFAVSALANGTVQSLPFAQDWTNTGLITANDDWTAVPGIIGFLGDSDPVGAVTAVDPQTLTADVAVQQDVIAQAVTTNTAGGVGEFDGLTDPVVGLQGSGTADAPYLLLNINTFGKQNIGLAYSVRDIDGTADNATQQCCAQFRVGTSGTWTNIAGSYIADATTGPSLATLVTPISVVLPASANNQTQIQIRILTTNAIGSDEWIGIDSIRVTGDNIPVPTSKSNWSAVKALFR